MIFFNLFTKIYIQQCHFAASLNVITNAEKTTMSYCSAPSQMVQRRIAFDEMPDWWLMT